jgi:UDP-N-acetylglucosamine--N-acetylmuramyl-(pentapeptide) pyrophosphoryl-undecaprenol N-acetylglucosamine transferase
MAVINALPHLKDLGKRIRIIHQTGEKDLDTVRKHYKECETDAEVLPFIMDMAAAYRSSSLLVCRAGATTIAEITASGKAAVLIPFPFAVNDHQTKNAEVLVRQRASVIIHEKNLNGQKLAETIAYLYNNPDIIKEMEENSSRLGNIKAASDIVDTCEKMCI